MSYCPKGSKKKMGRMNKNDKKDVTIMAFSVNPDKKKRPKKPSGGNNKYA